MRPSIRPVRPCQPTYLVVGKINDLANDHNAAVLHRYCRVDLCLLPIDVSYQHDKCG